jgi:hypothetical protein
MARTPANSLDDPDYWPDFVRTFVDAAEAGGLGKAAAAVARYADTSGIPANDIVARLRAQIHCNAAGLQ